MGIDEEGFLGQDILNFRAQIREKYPEYFKYAEKVNRFCQEIKYHLKIPTADGRQVISACLMMKVLNDLQGAIILFERGMNSQGRSLLRVAAEGVIILGNIAFREDFYQTYILVGQKERLKIINAMQSRQGPEFSKAPKGSDLLLPELTKEIQNQINGIERKQIKEWAGKIGLSQLYDLTFRFCSSDVHSDTRCLEEFIEWGESDYPVDFLWGPDSNQSVFPYLLETSRLFLYCMKYVNKVFDLNINEKLEKLLLEYEDLDKPL